MTTSKSSRRENFQYLKEQIQELHRQYFHPYFRKGIYKHYEELVKRNYASGDLTEKQMQKLIEIIGPY